jgi:hypothetical protein
VDAHLEEIPGLGTLTARGLAGLLSWGVLLASSSCLAVSKGGGNAP